MQQASNAYAQAITAGYRRILPRALIDITDPDLVYDPVTSSGQSWVSVPQELCNKVFDTPTLYASLESERWTLDGSRALHPGMPNITGENGFVGAVLSQDDKTFAVRPWVQLNVHNLGIMQACSVYFSQNECDGLGTDFTVEVMSGDTVGYRETVTGNTDASVYFEGFTVHDVTAIRVTFAKWSLPHRFVRMVEIVPGIYESWEADTLYSIDVMQEIAFNCMKTPYGTCSLQVHNKKKRFNPYNRSGLFQSIEERQGIQVSMGVETETGAEYLPLGVYYQQFGAWETDAYGLTIEFKLVDIIGLLADRDYNVPATLPTTLSGWIASMVALLGENFTNCWIVDEPLGQIVLTVNSADELKDMNCGNLLRYLCMAAQTAFRADAVTGKLRVFLPKRTDGVTIGADNMNSYPKNQPEDSIAQIKFRLADEDNTEYTVNGTLAAADKSLSISNPFIHTAAQADAAAQYILSWYGRTQFTVYGRGDMRCELGDVDSVWTGFDENASGRRFKQQFKIENGVMKNVPSYLLEVTDNAG